MGTNLKQEEVSYEKIAKIYLRRWEIELLWKFLNMHLKVRYIDNKKNNFVSIQIYSYLIAYLILQLIKIPVQYGTSLFDKLRYLQGCMCKEVSYVY